MSEETNAIEIRGQQSARHLGGLGGFDLHSAFFYFLFYSLTFSCVYRI
jgi:hypothetical protein